jgi:hypothetical protein
MNICVRDAQPEDFDKITRIAIEAYQEYAPALSSDSWDKMQASLSQISTIATSAKLIVAHEDDSLVGSIAYYPPGKSNPNIFPPDWASLRFLAVHHLWFYRSPYVKKRKFIKFVEGINNKLKLIKRLGYGFRNFENFKLRSLLTWHFRINYS